jgi:hypothetical protein
MDGIEVRHVRVTVFPDGRVDRKNAAAYLGREPKTLAQWAYKGIGPRSFTVGGRSFYRMAELQAFVAAESLEPARAA